MPLRNIPYKYIVAAVFVSGLFMDIMDSTVVNVTLPTLGREFHAGNTTLEWIITGYLLSLAVWIPAAGWVGDRFGTKKTFLFAMAIFTGCSALCGFARSIDQLILFRVLQGVGGGMMTPVGTAMLFRAFPPEERPKASAILAVPTQIAPALGPIFGGWLVTSVSWRWIFYINLPVGILGFTFALLCLKEHTEEAAGGFDLWGLVFSGGGLALVLYALAFAPSYGWTSTRVMGTGIAGVLCFVLLVVVELRSTHPILNLRLFSNRMFRNANLVFFMNGMGFIGTIFLLPLLLQEVLGATAFESGLTTFPQAIAMMIGVQFTSRLYRRVGPRRMLRTGMIGTVITASLFMLVGLGTNLWWIRGIMFLRGLGMAFTIVSNQAATFSTIKPKDMGRASSLFSTNRQVSGSVGVAVLATVLASRTKVHVAAAAGAVPALRDEALRRANLMAFHDAFFGVIVFAMLGICFTFLIHDEDALAALRPVPQEQPNAVEQSASAVQTG